MNYVGNIFFLLQRLLLEYNDTRIIFYYCKNYTYLFYYLLTIF